MQTIKGLIALLLVAAAVFAVMARNDIKSQDRYAAKLRNPEATYAIETGKQTVAKTATNVVNQARRKISKM